MNITEYLTTLILKNICQQLLLTPLEKTLVIKTKLLDLLLMLVIALANQMLYSIKYEGPTVDTRQQVSTIQLQPIPGHHILELYKVLVQV